MNFATALLRTFVWRPHRAIEAVYWYLSGRKVRARKRLRMAVAESPRAYPIWMSSVEKLTATIERAPSTIAQWQRRPVMSIVALAQNATTLGALIAALQHQPYADWELLAIVGDASAHPADADPRIRPLLPGSANASRDLGDGITSARGDYVIPLDASDQLSPAALFRFAEALQQRDRPVLIYGDEDRIDPARRRTRPWFKPDWNEEMFLAQDFIGTGCAIETAAARRALPLADDLAPIATAALLMSVTADPTASIRHLHHILVHRTKDVAADQQLLRIEAVARRVRAHAGSASAGPFGSVRISWPLPVELPLVSIIVPTRDKVGLLRACIDGVLAKTSYPNFDVMIVDNGSIEPATFAYFDTVRRDSRVRVVRYDAAYNYSAINNFAVGEAAGSYLCLLNNDTEILDGNWLTELMRQALRPHVGAVGAKLLYDDGSIQHAGVIIGLGQAAGHAHRFVRNDEPGYFNQPHVQRYVGAVTAACLVVDRAKFEAVGGLDADALAIAFNDVDLCLKLAAAGWRNVYAPQAILIHHESRSRGRDVSPQHIDRYLRELDALQQRWGTKTYLDPHYSPNLSRDNESSLIHLPE